VHQYLLLNLYLLFEKQPPLILIFHLLVRDKQGRRKNLCFHQCLEKVRQYCHQKIGRAIVRAGSGILNKGDKWMVWPEAA
jgi:hypothetical protein